MREHIRCLCYRIRRSHRVYKKELTSYTNRWRRREPAVEDTEVSGRTKKTLIYLIIKSSRCTGLANELINTLDIIRQRMGTQRVTLWKRPKGQRALDYFYWTSGVGQRSKSSVNLLWQYIPNGIISQTFSIIQLTGGLWKYNVWSWHPSDLIH